MYELDGQIYNLPISLVKLIRIPSLPQLPPPSAVSVMSLLLLWLKKSLLKMLPSLILLRSRWYCRYRNALTIASPKDLSLKEL